MVANNSARGTAAERLAAAVRSSHTESEEHLDSVFSWLHFSPPRDSPVHAKIEKHFRAAMPGTATKTLCAAALREYGFTPESTIFGQSICPDEVNYLKGGFCYKMSDYWGESFPMGGIGGAPFVGTAGFQAFSQHIPDDGNMLVLFGVHVAISENGELGKIVLKGQHEETTCCGPVMAAYEAVKGEAAAGASDCARTHHLPHTPFPARATRHAPPATCHVPRAWRMARATCHAPF